MIGWIILGVIALVIIAIVVIRLKNREDDDDSFLSMTRNSINNGCKKLLERIRGC